MRGGQHVSHPTRAPHSHFLARLTNPQEDFAKRGKAGVTDYDAGGPNHVRVQYNKCGCM